MFQRIKWVDEQFRDVPRVILSISLKRHLHRKRFVRSDFLVVEEVNLFMHFPRILYLAWHSDCTYVHSCYNALGGLLVYFLGLRIVTDLHGVVPEESRLMGATWLSQVLSIVERIVAKRSVALVFVTDAMRKHFMSKYSLSDDTRTYIVPIITRESRRIQFSGKDQRLVIYAGGLQEWQRVDQMLDAVKRTKDKFKYVFLTADLDNLRRKLDARGMMQVQVDSVPRDVVFEYYERASLGFVLREDSIINRVACPTKLVEYLWSGVIPIVEQPFIGDFFEMGYKYILVHDFTNGALPDPTELDSMREHNRQIARRLEELGDAEFTRMRKTCIER
jgi:glycosyltransferase involved in cell wall biosynthesis